MVVTGVTLQRRHAIAEENMGPVQCKRKTLHLLTNVPSHALSRLSAAGRRYKSDFDRKMSFSPVTNAEDFVYVDRPLQALTDAERPEAECLNENIREASPKLLQNSEELYCARSATETVVHIDRDGVTTSVSTDGVTKIPTGHRAAQPSAATGGEVALETIITEAVQNSKKTVPVGEDKEEHSIQKLIGHSRTEKEMHYRVRRYGYSSSKDT